MSSQATVMKPLTNEHSETGLWEEVPCNLCGSKNAQVKYQGTTDPDTEKLLRSYSASGNFVSNETLVECNDCGLIYTSPRLHQDLILKGYTEAEDPTYVSQAKGRILSFGQCLKAVEKFVRQGRVLDVGAAAGFFLKVAKDKGWKTYGIEPSKFLSDFGNKNYDVNITCGTVETVTSFPEKMDVVTLWDVLEHTFDPKDVLKRCNRYLKEGGYVVVNYPNIGNWMARLAGRHYWFILSVHLYYFVPKTIQRMLEETGFSVVSSRPHFQWLELGYLVYRLEAYLPGPARWFGKLVNVLGLNKVLVPYFAAQTRVIARKVEAV
ncbi:class I SAM-dependent methyltransferase [bacterium]|nr:class I SAM-dependent methyltransferase [bacterium]NBW98387.1 class I SAM-dependent methyltransferase [bacterium]NBX83836.1 class I SAM-dependent methyltransferase [bacterium]